MSFVQSKNEIDFILNKTNQKVVFVPLNLDSMVYLKKRKLFFLNPITYFKNEEHKKALSFTEKFISRLDYGNLEFEGLKKEFRSQIRFILNSCIFIIELYKKIIQEKNFSLVISGWHGSNLERYGSKEIFLSSFIIFNCFNLKNLIIITSDFKRKKNTGYIFNYFFDYRKIKKNNILINSLGYNFYRILLYKKLKEKVYCFNFEKKKTNLIKKFIFFLLGYREIIPRKEKVVFQQILNIPNISIMYENYNLSQIINSRKEELVFELTQQIKKLDAIKNVLKNIKFKNYFSFHSRGLDGSISELLLNKGCKTINISHGTVAESYGKYDFLYKKIISDSVFSGNFDCFAIQSKLCEKSLKNTNSNITNKIITGNLIFSDVKKIISNNQYFLYAVTLKKFDGLQFFGVEMYYEFLENLDLLNRLANKKIKFIVNIHASHSYLLNDIKFFFPNLVFKNNIIDKVLNKSFALISFSSTAIEDALVNNRYVILFDQWKRYIHFKPRSYEEKNIIYYVNSKEELSNVLEELREKKKYKKTKFLVNDLKENYNKLFCKNYENNY